MARFFIDRPVFAWVIALLIMLAGLVSLTVLPVSQYPAIAPPSIEISATYPGASAQVVEDTVSAVIEREMNGAEGLVYMSATSAANRATITLTFKQGTDPDLASVDVQNRLKTVESLLPEAVRDQGVRVEKTSASFLAIISINAKGEKEGGGVYSAVELGEFASSNVVPVLKRVEGIGKVTLWGTESAMRIWPKPDKLAALNVTASDIVTAVKAYNSRIIIGQIGVQNVSDGAPINAPILADQTLSTPEEFAHIPLRMNPDGSALRIGDVADVEVGAADYNFISRMNAKPAVGLGIQLTNDANALATINLVQEAMDSIEPFFPKGIGYEKSYDTASFVRVSITQVVSTLVEAIFLVFLVMFLFMQNLRATVIPTIVVPVALLGTFAVMKALGFSINMLTMFGMVLAIGILVDDAIVVVENVERIMREEGLSPREASIRAMGQISGAIIGITAVLVSVFIPMAFFTGAAGNIYRQFSVSLSVSIAFSAFLALSLTPALCATFLKPLPDAPHGSEDEAKLAHNPSGIFGRFFSRFNAWFIKTSSAYSQKVGVMMKKPWRWMGVYAMIIAVAALLFVRLPSSFIPPEDQGMFLGMIILPPGSTQADTLEVVKEFEKVVMETEPVAHCTAVVGFSFYGSGPSTAMSFINLKPWHERGKGQSVAEIVDRVNARFRHKFAQGVMVMAMNLPALPELGTVDGFDFRMQDRGGIGYAAMVKNRDALLAAAAKEPSLAAVRFAGMNDAPQLKLRLNTDKAESMGVDIREINSALAVLFGSSYVGDYVLNGQVRRIVVQADGNHRLSAEDLSRIKVRNKDGRLVEIGSFAEAVWTSGPPQLTRYNGFPSFTFNGSAAPGYSSGDAMETMEKLVSNMPGVGFEWSGQTYEERLAGNQAAALFSLSILVIFLVLSALYESWAIPFAVMLVVPLGIIGAVLGVTLRGLPNDLYFKVGLISIIGLSAKNAILIVEMAKELWREGHGLLDAMTEACRLRFRPILMTSLAFGFGVLPLALSTSSGAQRAIGTGVLGGIITGTALAVFMVPVFFVAVVKVFMRRRIQKLAASKQSEHEGRNGGPGGASALRSLAPLCLALPLLASLGSLTGCSMAPEYQRPAAPVPSAYGPAAEADPLGPLPDWQSYFPQPALREIIAKGLENNRDLHIALLRVEEARALYRVQRSERLPSVSASGGYFRGRTNQTGAGHSPVGELYSVGLGTAAFELDLWGRVKSLSDAALANYLATEEASHAARISLIANIVSLYMAERSLTAQEALTLETLASREASRDLTAQRLKAGVTTEIEMHTSEMLVESARSSLAAFRRERARVSSALKLVLGDPGYSLPENAPSLDEFSFARLAAGLPSELLENRPDIRMAEQRLIAANASIGAARAAFFPRIALTTDIGGISNELENIFSGPAGVWSFVPSLVMPIFQGGRNAANLDLAETRKHIAVAEYEKTIQSAFTDVIDALNAGAFIEEQIEAQQKVARADGERLRLVTLRYNQGLANYLELLDAQRSIFDSNRELIRLKGLRLDSAVALYKALGGGWKAEQPPAGQ